MLKDLLINLFVPQSLIEDYEYKKGILPRVREHYSELQRHRQALEIFLMRPVHLCTFEEAAALFDCLVFHWSRITGPKHSVEVSLQKHWLTKPSDLETTLYREYLSMANMIMDTCEAKLVNAGFIRPKSLRVGTTK